MNKEDAMRFEFGANWTEFIEKNFSQERVEISRRHLLDFLGKSSLEGLSFLDIGCGSGLHSLAAWQAGASSVHSFDYDPQSIAITRELHRMVGGPERWSIEHGSVLDQEYMSTLGQSDIVYSWGVLHHTGDVWTALTEACKRVALGGCLYIAVYSADMHVNPPPEYWMDIKRRYVAAAPWRRRLMEASYIWRFHLYGSLRGVPGFLRYATQYKRSRGMSFMTDVRDWLGGWPMEFCYDADVVRFVTGLGFKLEKMKTGEANTEFLFSREESVTEVAGTTP